MTLALVVVERNTNNAMDKMLKGKDLAKYIEHTLLKPDTTSAQIEKLCQEAIEHSFYGVCVPLYYIKQVKKQLRGSGVKSITVVGFPLGYSSINSKAEDIKKAMEDRAHEVDMVMNIAAFKSGNYSHVRDDLTSAATLCRLNNRAIKIILETCYLTKDEIKRACEICTEVEVDFVKTSTGFGKGGAKVEDIRLLREHLPKSIKIKASGGIKTNAFANELIQAGASRIGSSSGFALLE